MGLENTFSQRAQRVAVVAVARKIAVAIWYLLMGKPFKAKEKTICLVRKLTDIAKLLGKNQVKNMGFKNYKCFAESMLQKIENLA